MTNEELADALDEEVRSREHTYEGTNTELLYEAARRLRAMPEGEQIEGWAFKDGDNFCCGPDDGKCTDEESGSYTFAPECRHESVQEGVENGERAATLILHTTEGD